MSAEPAPRDPPPADYYRDLAATVRARIGELILAHVPEPVPPKPIKVRWRKVKVGSIDLGAPLVSMVAAELDGDPTAGELYFVTPRAVIAIGFKNRKLVELGRVAFTGEHAVPEPRDVVGTAIVDGDEIVAASSPWVHELHVRWNNGTLVGQEGAPGFLVCPGVREQLQPGRNHFTTSTFQTRCRDDLVDAKGIPLHVRAELATGPIGKLTVGVERCAADKPCESIGKYEYTNVGIAFAIADVDRDGTPEVIVSRASAPNAPDAAKVITLGGNRRFFKRFQGGVAGLVTVDGDDADDIPEVLAAVRFPSSTRVDVWRLD